MSLRMKAGFEVWRGTEQGLGAGCLLEREVGGSGQRSASVCLMFMSLILGRTKSPLRMGMFCLVRSILMGLMSWLTG